MKHNLEIWGVPHDNGGDGDAQATITLHSSFWGRNLAVLKMELFIPL
jgi:hypothetical protein